MTMRDMLCISKNWRGKLFSTST